MSTPNELKELGNKLFSQKRYDEAVNLYTKAILRNPSVPTFFTNRALCYLKQQKWSLVIADCEHAIGLNPKSPKERYILGRALFELGQYDEAVSSLNEAYRLCKEMGVGFGDEISSILRQAKSMQWKTLEDKRISEEIELQVYLNKLIEEDKQRNINALLDASSSRTVDEEKVAKITEYADKSSKELNRLFFEVDERRKKRDVPDYLCGKISFEIMRDPVITPCGITYDRKDIEEHLMRVGRFDPISRRPLTVNDLIPNLAMKEVVDIFLEENGWAETW